MRIVTLIVILSLLDTAGPEATDQAWPETSTHERPAIGLVLTPALEGGGPWLMPAVRVSAPLGTRHSLDLEAGRIVGGSNRFSEIQVFYAAQIRFARGTQEENAGGGYLLFGLRHLRMKKLDGAGAFRADDPETMVTIGRGWRRRFDNGLLSLTELGFSGGRGFMAYATIAVQCRAGS